jgi:hypothetical protein
VTLLTSRRLFVTHSIDQPSLGAAWRNTVRRLPAWFRRV